MHEKKSFKKNTRKMNDEVRNMLEDKHDQEEQLKNVAKMTSD